MLNPSFQTKMQFESEYSYPRMRIDNPPKIGDTNELKIQIAAYWSIDSVWNPPLHQNFSQAPKRGMKNLGFIQS